MFVESIKVGARFIAPNKEKNIMANNKHRKKDSARLVWDTKPRRAPNPKDIEFQTAEVVIPNPARDEKQIPISFKDGLFGEKELDKQKMNRLIWGDNLLAMQALLTQGYEGKINLIYIDPPFDSKADYSHKMTITLSSLAGEGRGEGIEFTKEPSVIERLAYKDTWAGGTDSYLDMLYPRLQLMKRLLAEDGSIWVHIGSNISHYVQSICDEIFHRGNCRNQVIVKRITKNLQRQFETIKSLPEGHDVLLWYSREPEAKFKPLLLTQKPKHIEGYWKDFWSTADRPTMRYEILGVTPTSGQWKWKYDKAMQAVDNYEKYIGVASQSGVSLFEYWFANGQELDFIRKSKTGKIEHWVPPIETKFADSLWLDISAYSFTTGFNTEKNEILLSRIIENFSNPGDLVADFFCGSGTTRAVAEKLNRRWIGCELGKVGIQVTRARLVEQQATPFLIENIGNYQREMIYLTGGRIWEMQTLILKLYGATPRDKTSGLGIRKVVDTPLNTPLDPLLIEGKGEGEGKGNEKRAREELVYVGYPDRPITARKAEELALQAQKLDGRGYKRLVILGWDYEYNYHQALESRTKALKDKLKVEIISRDIPPDVYDYLKKAKTEDDIEAIAYKVRFYERPYLRLSEPEIKDSGDGKVQVKIVIKRYVLMDIPVSHTAKKEQDSYNALMKLAKDNFAVLIDYWAIDWDYDGCTFKSQWQAFRGNGKKAKTVPIVAIETLDKKEKRIIAVRVVDIFGNDAGATIEI